MHIDDTDNIDETISIDLDADTIYCHNKAGDRAIYRYNANLAFYRRLRDSAIPNVWGLPALMPSASQACMLYNHAVNRAGIAHLVL